MNWDIFWLVIWIVALFVGTPIITWLVAVLGMASAVKVGPGKFKVSGMWVLTGIILWLGWLILVVYNIINQIITLINGG
jgi:hypothetical protein